MSFAAAAGHSDPSEDFARELQRVVVRMQSLGPQRLGEHAENVRLCLENIADAAWVAEHARPGRPDLPQVPAHAWADQLTVLARDLLDAEPDAHVLTAAEAELIALRRALP